MELEEQIREIARQEATKILGDYKASVNTGAQPEYIARKEFQKLYGVSGATVYRHIKQGHITLVKFGGKSFFKRSEIEKVFVPVS